MKNIPMVIFDPSKPSPCSIKWKIIEKRIMHLQCRISRAKQQDQTRLVRDLQRLLVRSLSAKLLVTKHLDNTQINTVVQKKEEPKNTKEFLNKYFLCFSRKKSKDSKEAESFYNLKLNKPETYKKILMGLWNLALLPAVLPYKFSKTEIPSDEDISVLLNL